MEQGKVRISLEGEFSATELEEIIGQLAQARAATGPAVPLSPPTEMHPRDILVQDETKFAIRKLANGGLRFWLRNEGIGWLAFTMTATDATSLREFLLKEGLGQHQSH